MKREARLLKSKAVAFLRLSIEHSTARGIWVAATPSSGPNVSLRITKNEGVPVTIVPEGTPGSSVVAERRVDELGFYKFAAMTSPRRSD